MNIFVREISMPITIKGFVVRCYEDLDYFTIVVNSSLSEECKNEVIEHEMDHINRGDFSSCIPAGILEEIRHAK